MQDLLLVEEVDVRRLSDPEDSRVCTISKMQLPAIKLKNWEHVAGGSFGAVKYGLPIIEALEPTMSTKGLDAGTMKALGAVLPVGDAWVFVAAVRDIANDVIVPVRATIVGRLIEYNPGEHTPGSDPFDVDHAYHEVTSYELKIGGDVWFAWSRKPRVLVCYGNDIGARYVSALGA